MKVYQIIQNKRTYKAKWAVCGDVRKERKIEISKDESVVGMFMDSKLAKKSNDAFIKSMKDFESRRNIKTEIIGKSTSCVDEVVLFDYDTRVIEVEKTDVSTLKNGKACVNVDGVSYVCGDPVKELVK